MWTPGSTTVSETPPPSSPERFGAWRQLRKHRTALLGLIVLGGFLVLTTLAPLILPYDPNMADLDHVLLPPSLAHPFGTDHLGRDLLTRVVFGTRVSFLIGILAPIPKRKSRFARRREPGGESIRRSTRGSRYSVVVLG